MGALIEFFQSLVHSNPYFSAGAGLVGLGSGLAVLRTFAKQALVLARRRYLVTLEIPSKDKSYQWVLQWISSRGHQTQHLSVSTTFHQEQNGKINTKFDYIPSPGTHYMFYNRNWIKVERSREKAMLDVQNAAPWETVTLTAFGRDRSIFTRILQEAKDMALSSEEGKTVIYTAFGSDWRTFGFPRRRRPFHSVVLDKDISSRILADVREFINNPKWYLDRGKL
jgi:chaperone BCS1